jgi:hypothetical protein
MSPPPSPVDNNNDDTTTADAMLRFWKDDMASQLERELQWLMREKQWEIERAVLWAVIAIMVVAFAIHLYRL